ncbi:MAG: hypothetical protein KIT79_06995 [Deltaproteobacteria bacterium]|nr:hypothetical protein [Deltaproteobacteria bacterium]
MSSQTVKNGFAALGVTATYKSVNLGPTVGGASLRIERELVEILTDERGLTPVDYLTHGLKKVDVTLSLARWSLMNFQAAFPEFTLTGSGDDRKLDIRADTGTSLESKAGQLVLHPVSLLDGDRTFDLTFWKAAVISPPELAYRGEQAPVELTFRALPDSSGLLLTIGDPSVT